MNRRCSAFNAGWRCARAGGMRARFPPYQRPDRPWKKRRRVGAIIAAVFSAAAAGGDAVGLVDVDLQSSPARASTCPRIRGTGALRGDGRLLLGRDAFDAGNYWCSSRASASPWPPARKARASCRRAANEWTVRATGPATSFPVRPSASNRRERLARATFYRSAGRDRIDPPPDSPGRAVRYP